MQSTDETYARAAAFDCAPIGQAILTVDGRFLAANPALHLLLGYPVGELLELGISDVREPGDVDAYRSIVRRLLAGERGPVRQEQRYLARSGTLVLTAESLAVITGPDGSSHRVVLQLEELTAVADLRRQLVREQDRVREAQLIGRLGSWEVDIPSGLVTWSDALFELRGVDKKTFNGDFSAATSMVHPEDRQRVRAAIEDATRTGQQTVIRYRASRVDDQSVRWFDARFKGLYQQGEMVTLAGTVVDVTEDVLAEEKIRSAYALQQAIITASPDITFLYDIASEGTVWSSRPLWEYLGYPPAGDSSAEVTWAGLVPELDRPTVSAAWRAASLADDNDVISANFRLLDASGNLRWFSCRTIALNRSDDGGVAQVVGVLRDITEAKAVEQRLQHLALHDDLTGLANRALLIDRIQGSLLRSARDGREVSVLYCDLDGFKRVNDTAGHAAGDAVLMETARRLESVLREGDTVARVGGDEFVLVVEPWNRPELGFGPPGGLSGDRELGRQIADRVANVLRRPIEVNGVEHVISASIGVTYGPMVLSTMPTDVTADAVLQDADAAMYTAKQRGKDRFEVFEYGMRTDLVERGRVERVLRSALRSGQVVTQDAARSVTRAQPNRIWAVYQPIFSAETGTLAGFEALARLADAAGTPIAPDVFIPIAEETGLIQRLGAFVLDQALGQLASWRSRWPEYSALTMAVNVSAMQVAQSSLAEDVRRAVSAHGLQPKDLVLEVTETSLLQAGRSSITALEELHAEGMGIDIDDFGVGYASLRYLATMPVSGVKIDRSFTARLPADTVSRKIVGAIAALAADLELYCTVEGVETADQQHSLPEGVRVQGWHTGMPQHAANIDLPALARGFGLTATQPTGGRAQR